MKLITINQLRFAISLAILTIIFRYGLSTSISTKSYGLIWIIASIYGIAIFMIGWIFGKKDRLSLNLYDVGFRFHLTTYIICNLIAELWFIFGFNAQYEKIRVIHLTAIFWGLLVIVHFIFFLITRKYSIAGIKKSEIFE